MIENLSSMTSEADLHICSHIEPESLPAMIQPAMALAQSEAEKDMLLLSLLTAAGSCMPNLYFKIYVQERRDFNEHPLSDKEKRARADWSVTCREAPAILRDKSHPRYMELYHRWRVQLNAPQAIKQFPNFVRHVLSQES